jgi:hypothetical protein
MLTYVGIDFKIISIMSTIYIGIIDIKFFGGNDFENEKIFFVFFYIHIRYIN